jgi:hypothetical protein
VNLRLFISPGLKINPAEITAASIPDFQRAAATLSTEFTLAIKY